MSLANVSQHRICFGLLITQSNSSSSNNINFTRDKSSDSHRALINISLLSKDQILLKHTREGFHICHHTGGKKSLNPAACILWHRNVRFLQSNTGSSPGNCFHSHLETPGGQCYPGQTLCSLGKLNVSIDNTETRCKTQSCLLLSVHLGPRWEVCDGAAVWALTHSTSQRQLCFLPQGLPHSTAPFVSLANCYKPGQGLCAIQLHCKTEFQPNPLFKNVELKAVK